MIILFLSMQTEPGRNQIQPLAEEGRNIRPYAIFFLLFIWLSLLIQPGSALTVINSKGPRATNVVLITLDTTRADRLGYSGYERARTPNIDRLAGKGACFTNAYTSVPLTLPSHSSIMTGTYPAYHRVHNNGFYRLPQELETMAEILKINGYKTAAFVSSFTVDSRFGLDQGFDHYDDSFEDKEILKNFRTERTADKTFSSFASWLEGAATGPLFVWLHFFDPHLPYNPPPPFSTEFAGHPYDGEIAFVDSIIGQVINKLKEKNLLNQSLIIIAGDHGEALGERREIDHGLFLYDNTMKVPLIFFSEKDLPSRRIEARVRLIDILPTVLDFLGLPTPSKVQGTSLIPYIKGKQQQDLDCYLETYYPAENFGWSALTGFIKGRWKYIRAPIPELYDLSSDRFEEHNLFSAQASVARSMLKDFDSYLKVISSKQEKAKIPLSGEALEKLRSLGYLGAGSRDNPAEGLPDPKNKIEDYILYYRGNLYETQGKLEQAAECYEKVLELNPLVPGNFVNLAYLYMKMDRVNEAIGLLEKARAKFPESILILSRLMTFYLRAERWVDAASAGEEILKADPEYFDALFLVGSAKARLGKWGEALEYYQRALKIEPENRILRQRQAFTLFMLGRHREALEIYEDLKESNPSEVSLYLEMAQIYEQTGNHEKASESLKQAIALAPGPDSYLAMAFYQYRRGSVREAISHLQKYLETAKNKDEQSVKRARQLLRQWQEEIKKKSDS
jgi:arylsulfatase A-like enzyme/Flp pilus assembly protein TadD